MLAWSVYSPRRREGFQRTEAASQLCEDTSPCSSKWKLKALTDLSVLSRWNGYETEHEIGTQTFICRLIQQTNVRINENLSKMLCSSILPIIPQENCNKNCHIFGSISSMQSNVGSEMTYLHHVTISERFYENSSDLQAKDHRRINLFKI